MKPIFEPGDFPMQLEVTGYDAEDMRTLVQFLQKQVIEIAHKKLASLGIDADTPEKLKGFEYAVQSWKRDELIWIEEVKGLKSRLADLERRNSGLREMSRELGEEREVYRKKWEVLDQRIVEAPTAFGFYDAETETWYWNSHKRVEMPFETHTAKLVDVKEIYGRGLQIDDSPAMLALRNGRPRITNSRSEAKRLTIQSGVEHVAQIDTDKLKDVIHAFAKQALVMETERERDELQEKLVAVEADRDEHLNTLGEERAQLNKLLVEIEAAPTYYAYRNSAKEWAVCAERFDWCTHTVRLVGFEKIGGNA